MSSPRPRSPAPRNIGVLAHIDAGKTTLTEQILYLAGEVRRPGAVDYGSTVTDWLPEERRRGITVTAAASSCRWRGKPLTLVDTPGHVDFTVEVERSLRVLDGAVLLLSGPEGVQAQTETVWHQIARRALPTVGFVNKLDRSGVDLEAVASEVRERLGIEPVWMTVPVMAGVHHVSLGHVLSGEVETATWRQARNEPAHRELRAPTGDEVALLAAAREELLEAIAVHDDAFAERFLDGVRIGTEEIAQALAGLVAQRRILPLWLGAAARGIGVGDLLDGVVALLPDADARPPARCFDLATGDERPGGLDVEDGQVTALVFKTERRMNGTRLAWVRVFAGAVRPGDRLRRYPSGDAVNVAATFRIVGGEEDPLPELAEGEIGGLLVELGEVSPRTGETLAPPGFAVALEPITPPAPVVGVALEAEDLEGHRVMRAALAELVEDDPSLVARVDPATGQTILHGMGELHLELAVTALAARVGAPLRTGAPRVRPALILRGRAAGAAQSASDAAPSLRAVVALEMVPTAADRSVTVSFASGTSPRAEWRTACEAGVREALRHAGGDVVGIEVTVTTLEARRGEPAPVHFRNAAMRAARETTERAGVVAAEPWMTLELVVPPESVGAVTGDMARRRGRVVATRGRGTQIVLHAEAPLGDLIGYATPFRSLTSGRGTFTMAPAGYRPLAGGERP